MYAGTQFHARDGSKSIPVFLPIFTTKWQSEGVNIYSCNFKVKNQAGEKKGRIFIKINQKDHQQSPH